MSSAPGLQIYFSASISGGRADASLYATLITAFSAHGHVLTEHIGSPDLSDGGESGPADAAIYIRDLRWLEDADVLVAEVTTPSLGVGYEVARASMTGKPVVCLFRPESGRRLSAMIRGNPHVRVLEYAAVDAPEDVAERAMLLAANREAPA